MTCCTYPMPMSLGASSACGNCGADLLAVPAKPQNLALWDAAWGRDHGDEAEMATCAACSEHITLIGGEWTTDDGTIACYADMSAPFVPHKPGVAA